MYHHIDKAGEILKDNNELADFSMTFSRLDMCVSLPEMPEREVIELSRISGFFFNLGSRRKK